MTYIRDNAAELANLFTKTSSPFCILEKAKITFANKPIRNLFKCSRDSDIIGKPISFFLDGEAFEKGNVPPVTTRQIKRQDGSISWMDILKIADNGPAGKTALLFHDVTKHKHEGTSSAQQERLLSIGILTAGISHEINTPITSILTSLNLVSEKMQALSRKTEELTELSAILSQTYENACWLGEFAKSLRNFSRPDSAQLGPVDVRKTIDSSLNMVRHEIRGTAHIIKEYEDVRNVVATETGLMQVFINLIMNSLHAIREKKSQIKSEKKLASYEIYLRISQADPKHVEVEISDTGTGIPEAILPKIFERYFTTKGRDLGTGIGLNISKQIVESFAGSITASSRMGRGSTFLIKLPSV